MKLIKTILICSTIFCAPVSQAAEFEVMDVLTVNGITNLKSSATIIVPIDVPASIWVSTSVTTPHLYISTNGNVGIGTANPLSKAHIESNAGGGTIYVKSAAGNAAGLAVERPDGAWIRLHGGMTEAALLIEPNIDFKIAHAPGGSNPYDDTFGEFDTSFFIDGNGKVGIGTESPAEKLHIDGNILVKAASSISILYVNTTFGGVGIGTDVLGSTSKLRIQSDSAEEGLFYINTPDTLPQADVNPLGFIIDKQRVGDDVWAKFNLLNTTGDFASPSRLDVILRDVPGGGGDRTVMSLMNDGKVGIGDTSPEYKLDVAGTAGIDGSLTMTGSAANIALGSNYLSGDDGDEGISVDGSGNVGIGTAAPTKPLHIKGTDVGIAISDDDTAKGEIYWDVANNRMVIKIQ